MNESQSQLIRATISLLLEAQGLMEALRKGCEGQGAAPDQIDMIKLAYMTTDTVIATLRMI